MISAARPRDHAPRFNTLFNKQPLSSIVYVGSGARSLAETKWDRPMEAASCPTYGGPCLGDGCVNWFPTPSPPLCQEGVCGLTRDNQPIGLAEAKRRVLQNIRSGNMAARGGWVRSAQALYQRAWAYAALVEQLSEGAA